MVTLLVISLVYNFLVLGPFIPFIKSIINTDYQQVKLKKEFLQKIPNNASIVTTYDFLPNLSSRQNLYSLNYLFLGRQQYSAGEYKIPSNTQYILIDLNDFVTYHLQYEIKAKKYYYQGPKNLNNLFEQENYSLKKVQTNLALYQKNYQDYEIMLYQVYQETKPEIKNPKEQKLNEAIEFLGFNQSDNQTALFFKSLRQTDKNYFLQINDQLFGLAYGLYPTSQWQSGEIIQMNFF